MSSKFKTISNPKIFYDYEILEELECGMVLLADQVKQIASNKFSIVGTWCKVMNGELVLIHNDCTIKLLAHSNEISRLSGKTQEKGISLAPISIYAKKGKFKLRIALVKGNKEYDKREADKKKSIELDNRRTIKSQKMGEE